MMLLVQFQLLLSPYFHARPVMDILRLLLILTGKSIEI